MAFAFAFLHSRLLSCTRLIGRQPVMVSARWLSPHARQHVWRRCCMHSSTTSGSLVQSITGSTGASSSFSSSVCCVYCLIASCNNQSQSTLAVSPGFVYVTCSRGKSKIQVSRASILLFGFVSKHSESQHLPNPIVMLVSRLSMTSAAETTMTISWCRSHGMHRRPSTYGSIKQ